MAFALAVCSVLTISSSAQADPLLSEPWFPVDGAAAFEAFVETQVAFSDFDQDAISEAASLASDLLPTVIESAVEVAETSVVYREWWEPVTAERDWALIAADFGHNRESLEALNPDVDLDALTPGAELLVFQYDPENPPRSHRRPDRGRLLNGMPMPDGDAWTVRNRREAWGTWYTVSHLVRGLTATREAFPKASTLLIADISNRRGGRMSPHRSHQSGRDVDVTYYLIGDNEPHERFQRAGRRNFDAAVNWHLFRYWIERDLVEYIFVDRDLQRRLLRHARAIGESEEFIEQTLQVAGGGRAIIRDSPGHNDHFHVRFRCHDETDRACSN